jgi:hypothetical protein
MVWEYHDTQGAVLKRIGQHPINQIDDLLPWNIDLAKTADTDAL